MNLQKNNFIKKCPNCSIITEKSSGCNHIICSKCNFQWCWLCNKKYYEGHYKNGKCKGFQFFKPKDENDIKLAFEGKIELRDSQRQFDLNEFENVNFNNYLPNDRRIRRPEDLENIRIFSCGEKVLKFLIYIFFWHLFTSLISMNNRFMRNCFVIFLICMSYLFLQIVYFFQMIYFNLLMLMPYLIKEGLNNFLYAVHELDNYTNLTELFFKFLLFVLNIFYGGFFIY